MRENRKSGSMRGCRKRATSRRACALLYGGSPAPKELLPRTLQFSRLCSRFFFDGYQFVAKLVGLPFEFCFEAFLPLGVALRPKRRVVGSKPAPDTAKPKGARKPAKKAKAAKTAGQANRGSVE